MYDNHGCYHLRVRDMAPNFTAHVVTWGVIALAFAVFWPAGVLFAIGYGVSVLRYAGQVVECAVTEPQPPPARHSGFTHPDDGAPSQPFGEPQQWRSHSRPTDTF